MDLLTELTSVSEQLKTAHKILRTRFRHLAVESSDAKASGSITEGSNLTVSSDFQIRTPEKSKGARKSSEAIMGHVSWCLDLETEAKQMVKLSKDGVTERCGEICLDLSSRRQLQLLP